jgi:hypothetical protein
MSTPHLTEKAFEIADQHMLELLLSCTWMVDGNLRLRQADDPAIITAAQCAETMDDIKDAMEWLSERGMAEIVPGDPLRVLIAEHVEI